MLHLLIAGEHHLLSHPQDLPELLLRLGFAGPLAPQLTAIWQDSLLDADDLEPWLEQTEAWLAELVQVPPAGATLDETLGTRRRWLRTIELLDRTQRLLSPPESLPFEWTARLSWWLQRTLQQSRLALEAAADADWWWFGREAEQQRTAGPAGLLPWSCTVWPTRPAQWTASGVEPRAVLLAWQREELDGPAEAALQQLVCAPGPWADEYRRLLADQAQVVELAPDQPAAAQSPPALIVPLPHLGRQAAYQVWAQADGSAAYWPGLTLEPEQAEPARHRRAGDAVTGPLTTELHLAPVARQARIWGQLRALLDRVADPDAPATACQAAFRAAADVLAEPELIRTFHSAATQFDQGLDPSEEQEWSIKTALQLRAGLDALAHRHPDPADLAELARLDEPFQAARHATLLLTPADYARAVAVAEPDPDAWWGYPCRLDRAISDEALTRWLEDPLPAARREPAAAIQLPIQPPLQPPRPARRPWTAQGLVRWSDTLATGAAWLGTFRPGLPAHWQLAEAFSSLAPDPTLPAHTVLLDDPGQEVRLAELRQTNATGELLGRLALAVELKPTAPEDPRRLEGLELLGPDGHPLPGWTVWEGTRHHPRLQVRVFPAQPGTYQLRLPGQPEPLRFAIGEPLPGTATDPSTPQQPQPSHGPRPDELDQAWRLFRYRDAIRLVLQEFDQQPRHAPRLWEVLRFRLAALEPDERTGLLAGDDASWSKLQELYHWALGSADPTGLEQLHTVPLPRLGAATVPSVIVPDPQREAVGILRMLHATEGVPDQIERGDDDFRQALQNARRLAKCFVRQEDLSRVDQIGFSLHPPLPDGVAAEGASVGLAALVALLSLIKERPIPAELAFSGVLQGQQLAAPGGFTQKYQALLDRPYLTTLFFPAPAETELADCAPVDASPRRVAGGWLLGEQMIQTTTQLEVLLTAVFEEPTRSGRPRHLSRARFDELRPGASAEVNRLLALLTAAEGPLTRAEAERGCRRLAPAQDPWQCSLQQVLLEVEAQYPGGIVQDAAADTLELTEDLRRYGEQLDRTQQQEAHRALAAELLQHAPLTESQWVRLVRHQAAAGALDERDAALRQLAELALSEAYRTVLELDARRGRGGIWSTALDRLPASLLTGEPAAGARWLYLALLVRRLPLPTAALAERLTDAPSWLGRLLVLQGIVESQLHLLAAAALALDPEPPGADTTASRLFRRPAIGLMVSLIRERFARVPPDGAGGAFGQRLAQLLATPPLRAALAGQGEDGQPTPRLDARLNQALHHLGAWQELLEHQAARHAGEALLEPITRLVEALMPLWQEHPLVYRSGERTILLVLPEPIETETSGGSYAIRLSPPPVTPPAYLDLSGWLLPLRPERPGDPGLFRGLIGQDARWVGYREPQRLRAPRPAAEQAPAARPEAAPVLAALSWDQQVKCWARAASRLERPAGGLLFPRLLLPALPLPLARAVIALKRGRNPAELLAAIDTAFAVLLRLAVVVRLATEQPATARPAWPTRATKRRLHELATAAPTPTAGPPAPELSSRLAAPAALELLDLLELLEHLPTWPTALEPEIQEALRLLTGLLESLPWHTDPGTAPILLGQAGGRRWRLMGPEATPEEAQSTASSWAEGALAFQPAEAQPPLLLGPYALLTAAADLPGPVQLWLPDEQRSASKQELTVLSLFTLGYTGIADRQPGHWVSEPGTPAAAPALLVGPGRRNEE